MLKNHIKKISIIMLSAAMCLTSVNSEVFAKGVVDDVEDEKNVKWVSSTGEPSYYVIQPYELENGTKVLRYQTVDTKRASSRAYFTLGFTLSRIKKYTDPTTYGNTSTLVNSQINEAPYYHLDGKREYIELNLEIGGTDGRDVVNSGSQNIFGGKVINYWDFSYDIIMKKIGFRYSNSFPDTLDGMQAAAKSDWAKAIYKTYKWSLEESQKADKKNKKKSYEAWAYVGLDAIMSTCLYSNGVRSVEDGTLETGATYEGTGKRHYDHIGKVYDFQSSDNMHWADWDDSRGRYTGGIVTAFPWRDPNCFRQRYGNYINILSSYEPLATQTAIKDKQNPFAIIKNWADVSYDSSGYNATDTNLNPNGDYRYIRNNVQTMESSGVSDHAIAQARLNTVVNEVWTVTAAEDLTDTKVYVYYDGDGDISAVLQDSDGNEVVTFDGAVISAEEGEDTGEEIEVSSEAAEPVLTATFDSLSAGEYKLIITRDPNVSVTSVIYDDANAEYASNNVSAVQIDTYKILINEDVKKSKAVIYYTGDSSDMEVTISDKNGSKKTVRDNTVSTIDENGTWSLGHFDYELGDISVGDSYTVIIRHPIGYSAETTLEDGTIQQSQIGVKVSSARIEGETAVSKEETIEGRLVTPLTYELTTTENINDAFLYVSASGTGYLEAAFSNSEASSDEAVAVITGSSTENIGTLGTTVTTLMLGTYTVTVNKSADVTIKDIGCIKDVGTTSSKMSFVLNESETTTETDEESVVDKGHFSSGTRYAAPGLYTGNYVYDAALTTMIETEDTEGNATGEEETKNDTVTFHLGSTLSDEELESLLDGDWDTSLTDNGGIPATETFLNRFVGDTWYGRAKFMRMLSYDNAEDGCPRLMTLCNKLNITYRTYWTDEDGKRHYYWAETVVNIGERTEYRIGAEYYEWKIDNLLAIANYGTQYIRSDGGDSFIGVDPDGDGALDVEQPNYILGIYNNPEWDEKYGTEEDGEIIVGSGSHLGNRSLHRKLIRKFMRDASNYMFDTSVTHGGTNNSSYYGEYSSDGRAIRKDSDSIIESAMNNGLYAHPHNDYFMLDDEVYIDDSTANESYNACDNGNAKGQKHFVLISATSFIHEGRTSGDGRIVTHNDMNNSSHWNVASSSYGHSADDVAEAVNLDDFELTYTGIDDVYTLPNASTWYGPKGFTADKNAIFNIVKCHEFSDEWWEAMKERNRYMGQTIPETPTPDGSTETVREDTSDWQYRVTNDVLYIRDQLVEIPATTANGYYYTNLSVQYDKFGSREGQQRTIVINDLSDKYSGYLSKLDSKGESVEYGLEGEDALSTSDGGVRGKKRAILPDDPNDAYLTYTGNEPIRIVTPASAPIKIEGGNTQIADLPDEKYVHNQVRKFAQLQLDGTYELKFDFDTNFGESEYFKDRYGDDTRSHGFGVDMDGDGYADAGTVKYLKDKQIRFPFSVQIEGVYYEPKNNVDGVYYTDWISLGEDCMKTEFYVPTWAQEGAYGLVSVSNENGYEMYDGWDSQNRNTSDYMNTGIQVRVLASNYSPGINDKEEYAYNRELGSYVATYNYSCYVCGVLYDYETDVINDETFAGIVDRVLGYFNFASHHDERVVGTNNRWGEPEMKYTKDGDTTSDWDPVSTLPFVAGKNRYFKDMGWLQLGDYFSFSVKTISTDLNHSATGPTPDLMRIVPTYQYVDPAGNIYDFDEMVFFYEQNGNLIRMGSSEDKAGFYNEPLDSHWFEDCYYDYHYSSIIDETATYYGLTPNQLMRRPQGESSMGEIKIPSLHKLFTYDEDQLQINTEYNAGDSLRYYTSAMAAITDKPLSEITSEEMSAFKKSMQTWYGTYKIPDTLYICFKDDFDSIDTDQLDLSDFKKVEEDGTLSDEGLWIDTGHLILNFDIITYTEISGSDYDKIEKDSNKYSYVDENGTVHYMAATMKYYLNEGGLDMWTTEHGDPNSDDPDPDDPDPDDPVNPDDPDIPDDPGTIAVISLRSSIRNKYKIGYIYIN